MTLRVILLIVPHYMDRFRPLPKGTCQVYKHCSLFCKCTQQCKWRHDTKHYDVHINDIGIQDNNSQIYGIQHNDIQHNSKKYYPIVAKYAGCQHAAYSVIFLWPVL